MRRRSSSSCAAKASSTFRELLRALEAAAPLDAHRRAVVPDAATASCTTRIGRSRARSRADFGCPNRAARVLDGYTLLGRQVDVVETSRGCTYDCSFCSIIEMRGRNFHTYPIDRVLADIADARAPRRARDLPRRRQHHARRPPVRGALPGDHRQRVRRHRLRRAGDDVAARRARRHARAADAARRIPLRVPRHREHPRRRPRVSQGARQEHPARRAGRRSAMPRSKRSSTCIATACSSSAA